MKTVEGLRKQNPNKGETAVIGSEVQYDGGLFVGGAGDIVFGPKHILHQPFYICL